MSLPPPDIDFKAAYAIVVNDFTNPIYIDSIASTARGALDVAMSLGQAHDTWQVAIIEARAFVPGY